MDNSSLAVIPRILNPGLGRFGVQLAQTSRVRAMSRRRTESMTTVPANDDLRLYKLKTSTGVHWDSSSLVCSPGRQDTFGTLLPKFMTTHTPPTVQPTCFLQAPKDLDIRAAMVSTPLHSAVLEGNLEAFSAPGVMASSAFRGRFETLTLDNFIWPQPHCEASLHEQCLVSRLCEGFPHT